MTMTTTTKTRPCRPGDILWRSEVPCGATATLAVVEPDPHPPSGVTGDASVRLRLTVALPAAGCEGMLQPSLISEDKCLSEALTPNWGESKASTRTSGGCRTGASIATIFAELVGMGQEALATVQAVADAHDASVARQSSARGAAYAAWPVRCEDESAD